MLPAARSRTLTLVWDLLYLLCCAVAQKVGGVLHKATIDIKVGLLSMVVAAPGNKTTSSP